MEEDNVYRFCDGLYLSVHKGQIEIGDNWNEKNLFLAVFPEDYLGKKYMARAFRAASNLLEESAKKQAEQGEK